ncbi:MAG: hypothetical protein ACOVQ7_24800 [Limnoraphis robusta]|jgi:hypothetical protein
MENNSKENQTQTTGIEVQEASSMNLIDKVADLAIENKDAGLVIAGAIATSIVICAIAHSAAKLIRAVRS